MSDYSSSLNSVLRPELFLCFTTLNKTSYSQVLKSKTIHSWFIFDLEFFANPPLFCFQTGNCNIFVRFRDVFQSLS